MPKILLIDVETAPIESYTWGLWDQNVGVEQIKTEWSIISYAAKWTDKPGIIYSDTSGRGVRRIRDDKALLGEIWKLLNEADIVVAQNGNSFDIKKINARLIMHGFKPYSPIRVIDTLTVAKRHFGFTSNKLAWLTKMLTRRPKDQHKEFPGFELWVQCMADNPKAWRVMKKYNIEDVMGTEEVYEKFRPWIAQHPNMATYTLIKEKSKCPKCASTNLQSRGYSILQHGKYQRYQCNDCGGWSRGKQNLLTPAERKKLLVST